MTEYELCCRCQGSGQCHVDSPTLGLPPVMQPIGGFYSCPVCDGTGKMLSIESFTEQMQEYLNDNKELLEAAFIAKETLKKKS